MNASAAMPGPWDRPFGGRRGHDRRRRGGFAAGGEYGHHAMGEPPGPPAPPAPPVPPSPGPHAGLVDHLHEAHDEHGPHAGLVEHLQDAHNEHGPHAGLVEHLQDAHDEHGPQAEYDEYDPQAEHGRRGRRRGWGGRGGWGGPFPFGPAGFGPGIQAMEGERGGPGGHGGRGGGRRGGGRRGPGGRGPGGPGGPGPFGPGPFGPPGFFDPRMFGRGVPPRGFGRGRRARKGDVRAGILALLSERPMNGYQIIQELTERSNGYWRPSPGSVYPALQQLEDEALVRTTEVEGRKAYELTDEGRSHVEERPEQYTAPWDAMSGDVDDTAQELGALGAQLGGAVVQVVQAGNDAQLEQAKQVLAEARRKLYRILAEDEPEQSTGDDGEE